MRRRKSHLRKESGTFALNITSMCDMFTLLLVFLLQTYATSDFQPDMDKNVSLPLSSSMKEPSRVPQITVTQDVVKIDGEIVAQLNNGVPKASDLVPGNPGLVKPLLEALRAKLPAEQTPQDAVLLHADSRQTMSTLNPFLTTISAAGFAKVKLATVVGR